MGACSLLQLPLELRKNIYFHLFSSLVLNGRASRSLTGNVYFSNNFTQALQCAAERLHSILLTCHQCHHEGISIFYKQAVVHDATEAIGPCFQPNLPSYHALPTDQHFFYRPGGPEGVPDLTIPAGTGCNIAMVVQASRHFIETSNSFRPFGLLQFQAMESLVVKIPERELLQWPILQETLSQSGRTSDQELEDYHVSFLIFPEIRAPRNLLKRGLGGVLKSTLLFVMDQTPRSTFTARVPVSYIADRALVHEICDYDLRTERIIGRQPATEAEITAEGFPSPEDRRTLLSNPRLREAAPHHTVPSVNQVTTHRCCEQTRMPK